MRGALRCGGDAALPNGPRGPIMNPDWLDGAPLPLGIIRDGCFSYVNEALVRLLGYSRDQLVGMPFAAPVAAEDRQRVADRHVQRRRGELVPDSYEFVAVCKDGARRTVEIFVTQVGDAIVFQLRDVTDRTAREAKLFELARLGAAVQAERTTDAVFAAVNEGLAKLGLAAFRLALEADRTLIVDASLSSSLVTAFERATGRSPIGTSGVRGPLADRAWCDGIGYADDMLLAMERFLGAPTTLVRDVAAAGLVRGVAVRIDVGSSPSWILLVAGEWPRPSDLPAFRLFGAQVSAALDAVRAQEQLVRRERLAALGELAAVVAHEVRNPLGVMFNSLGSIRRLLHLEGDAKLLLDIMAEEAERLNRIVSDLLDFAHPAMPAVRAEPLDRILDDAVAAAFSDSSPSIDVVREIDPELPPVPVDARLFRQAVLNIAINAVHAMPNGGTLTIRARRDPDLRTARIEIGDTGQGIVASDRRRIFEPFFTTKATGTGLGLAVVKRIVESHRGEVHVASTPGRGTTFAIVLPID